MSSKDYIESAAKGATKGFLDWSSEKISEFVRKLKDKKLAFIQEKKTIEIVKEQYASGEGKFYSKYIKDNELLFLVRMGLTLRRLEEDKERLENLKQKILKKFNVKGLHIAYFVQNGILNRYIGILVERITSIEDLEKNIADVLRNIEKHAFFVSYQDSSRVVVQKSLTITASHSPPIFIVSGIGQASKLVGEVTEKLEKLLTEYEVEKVSGGNKEILFFKRIVK